MGAGSSCTRPSSRAPVPRGRDDDSGTAVDGSGGGLHPAARCRRTWMPHRWDGAPTLGRASFHPGCRRDRACTRTHALDRRVLLVRASHGMAWTSLWRRSRSRKRFSRARRVGSAWATSGCRPLRRRIIGWKPFSPSDPRVRDSPANPGSSAGLGRPELAHHDETACGTEAISVKCARRPRPPTVRNTANDIRSVPATMETM